MPPSSPTRRVRWFRRAALLAAALLAAYVAIFLFPQPLFAHEARVPNVVLHAPAPLPPSATAIAAAARARLAASPFFDAADTYDVFLCDTPARFAWFAPLHPGVGGIAYTALNGDVFLRPSRPDDDRLVGPSGTAVPGERTLTYYVAHEITHVMVARRIGRVAYHRLAVWQQEGYADYVAKAGAFDYVATLRDFRAGARALDPAASGLYLRYHLLVAYLLEQRGLSPAALLGAPMSSAPVERALAAP